MSKPKLPTVFSLTGANVLTAKTVTPNATKRENFSERSVKDAQGLAAQLTRMHGVLEEAHKTATANPFAGALRFDSQPFPAGGATVVFDHRLGHVAHWMIVGWRPGTVGGSLVTPTSGPSLVEVNDPDHATARLTLKSFVAGVGDIMVF